MSGHRPLPGAPRHAQGVEQRRAEATPLARWLRDAGYHCAAFTEDGYIIRGLGFGDGFSEYTENIGFGRKEGGIPGEARLTFAQAQRWLGKNRRRPFFLFVHTYQVHAPYLPPPETDQMFRDDAAVVSASPALRNHHDAYDREIRFVDDKLRELVTALDARGLRDSTEIVRAPRITARSSASTAPPARRGALRGSLRIPLIFAGPGIPSWAPRGRQVSLIDVAPTLLEMGAAGIPEQLDGPPLPALRGEAVALPSARCSRRRPRPGAGPAVPARPWNPMLIVARTPGASCWYTARRRRALPTLRYDLAADADEHAPRTLEGRKRPLPSRWWTRI